MDPHLAIGPISQGTVPISVLGNGIDGYSISVLVTFQPTGQGIAAWRIGTFETIEGTYFAMKRQHDQDVANAELAGAGKFFGDSSSPSWNKQLMTEELKRQVIEFLVGSPFSGRNAIAKSTPLSGPIYWR